VPYIILSNSWPNHLWFLYLLVGLYLFTPILKIFVRNAKEKDLKYFLILFGIFGICIPFYNEINPQINTLLPNFPNSIAFSVSAVSGYIGYYVAGYYFSIHILKKSTKIGIYIIGGISILCIIIGTSIISLHQGDYNKVLCDHFGPLFLFISFAVFVLFQDIFNKLSLSQKTIDIITHLSNCSFGIYLSHWIIFQIFHAIGIDRTLFNPLLSVPCMAIAIMICSYIVTIVVKKIPILKEYVV
jgi:surface polysaccharide O-acyltransferase-like enzyme